MKERDKKWKIDKEGKKENTDGERKGRNEGKVSVKDRRKRRKTERE